MPTIDLLFCPKCRGLRRSDRRFRPRCGQPLLNGICQGVLETRKNPLIARIESWIALDVDLDLAAHQYAKRVDIALSEIGANVDTRTKIELMLKRYVEMALSYHRGDHGGAKPMHVVSLLDRCELRYMIRGHAASVDFKTDIR